MANADLRDRPGVMNLGRIAADDPAPLPFPLASANPPLDLLRPSLRGGVNRLGDDFDLARLAGDSAPRRAGAGAGTLPSSEGNALAAMAAAKPAGPPGWLMEVSACSFEKYVNGRGGVGIGSSQRVKKK